MGDRPSSNMFNKTVLAVVWGAYDTLKWYSERNPDADPYKIVLLDPVGNEEAARSYLPWEDAGITHIAAIPSSQNGQSEIFSYTHPGLYSLQQTTPALQSLFPGLRTKKVLITDHVSAALLSSALGEESFSLVLETPGAELSILEYFEETGLLGRIGTIHLRCGVDAFFDNASDESRIRTWLQDRFFQLVGRNDEDADWPQLAFAADLNARRLPLLERRILELEKTAAEGDLMLKKTQVESEQLRKALGEARSQAEASQKTVAERDAALKEAQAKREQLEKALGEARSQAETGKKAVAERDVALKETQAKKEQLEKALSEARSQAEANQKTVAERDAALKETQAKREQLEKALGEARSQAEASAKTIADRDVALKIAQAKGEQLEKVLSEARSHTETDKKAIAERDAALKAEKAGREQLEKTLKIEQGRVVSHKAATSRLQTALHEKEEALARMRGDYDRARQDMSVTLESLRATQADLADLRSRYTNLHDEKRQLEQLIRKLTPRLQEAAGQLRELFAPPSDNTAHAARARRNKTTKENK